MNLTRKRGRAAVLRLPGCESLPRVLVAAVPLMLLLVVRATEVRPLMRDFIGLNGHTIQFKPDLYAPVCRLVRDYHPVSWDLGTNTSHLPGFPFAKNGVDWSRVYGSWRDKDLVVDACLMFESIERSRWRDIQADARSYGRAFAREFGPSGTRRLVESVEVGNEPGSWSDSDYTSLFQSMAAGLREGDPALKIVTCNLTTTKSGKYEKSVACLAGLTNLFDVLNVHSYAQLENWPTWRRSFPEDPRLPKYLQDVRALCAWRDEHASGKPVWITEFGYDSSTQKPATNGTFAKWVGVTDEQQAQWLVRSLLLFSSMPVERAYIYFFNDDDKPSLHASAGLTRHFQPKPSYHAVAHLKRVLGGYRFEKVVMQQANAWVFQYQDGSSPRRSAWVAWSPTGAGETSSVTLDDAPGRVTGEETMPLDPQAVPAKTAVQNGRKIEIRVSGKPTYLFFEK